MHTHSCGVTKFLCNGDFYGDVIIKKDENEIRIPINDIVEFTACIVRQSKENKLMSMSDKELLGIE